MAKEMPGPGADSISCPAGQDFLGNVLGNVSPRHIFLRTDFPPTMEIMLIFKKAIHSDIGFRSVSAGRQTKTSFCNAATFGLLE